MMHPLDIAAWFRLGRPKAGRIDSHERFSYPFEEGIELSARLTSVFGDLNRISAIDLGAGSGESPIAANILSIPWRRLVSVEAFPPYLSKLHEKHSAAVRHDIFGGRIEHVFHEFKPGEIDVALLIDVLEHFSRWQAFTLISQLRRFCRLGVAIFLPVGKLAQEPFDENELQRHRSFWEARDLARLGFNVEVYEGVHGHLTPPASAAWAIKRWG